MSISFERNLVMGIAPEITYNLFTATGIQGIRVLKGSRLNTEMDVRKSQAARGQAAESDLCTATGLRRWTYDCTINIPKEAFSHVLLHLFGAVVSTGLGAFTSHTHNVNHPALGTSATPVSCSLRLYDDNLEWDLSGGVVASITFRLLLDNFMQADISFMGGTFTTNPVGTSSLPPFAPFAGTSPCFVSDHIDVNIGGTAFGAEQLEITFARNFADGAAESYESGGAERVRLETAGDPAAFEVTGFARRLYDTKIYYPEFDTRIVTPVTFNTTVVAAEQLVTKASDGYYFETSLDQAYVETWGKDPSSGVDMQRLDFRGYYRTTTDIEVVMQDQLTTPATQGTP